MYSVKLPLFASTGSLCALPRAVLFMLAMMAAKSAPAAVAEWQFQVSAATGNVLRGLDKSSGEPSLGIAASWYRSIGPFAGFSASSIKSPESLQSGVEFSVSAGYGWRVAGDWNIQTLLTHYQFERVLLAKRMNYDELELRGGWRESVFLSVTASPNTGFGPSPRSRSFSYNIAGRVPLPHGFSATAGVGYYDLRAVIGAGYIYGDAGLTYQYRSVQFDLWYITTRTSSAAEAKLDRLLFRGPIADLVWHF